MSSHSSEIRDLCLMKWSCEMLQSHILSNIQKPIVFLISFHSITLFFPYEIALGQFGSILVGYFIKHKTLIFEECFTKVHKFYKYCKKLPSNLFLRVMLLNKESLEKFVKSF